MTQMICRDSSILGAAIDDQLLIMSVEQGLYFSFNSVAARIWELLETPTTEEALLQQLLCEYEVDQEVCREQLSTFLADLQKRNLLMETTVSV